MWATTVTRIDARTAFAWLALAGWPLHVVFATASALTAAVAGLTAQPAIFAALTVVVAHYVLGLCASFAIHELGHAAVLARAPGVSALTLSRTSMRISVHPHGSILGRDAFLGAACGPLCAVAVGVLLWIVLPQLSLHIWYLAHAAFLAPVFSDGRVLIRTARAWNTRFFQAPPSAASAWGARSPENG